MTATFGGSMGSHVALNNASTNVRELIEGDPVKNPKRVGSKLMESVAGTGDLLVRDCCALRCRSRCCCCYYARVLLLLLRPPRPTTTILLLLLLPVPLIN